MKPLLSFLAVLTLARLFAGCTTTPESITARSSHFLELPFEEPPGGWNFNVRRGDSRASVLSLCGRPDFAIGDNHWIYWNICSPDKAAHGGRYDTLVMTFADDRVHGMRLVNGETLRRHFAAMLPRMSSAN